MAKAEIIIFGFRPEKEDNEKFKNFVHAEGLTIITGRLNSGGSLFHKIVGDSSALLKIEEKLKKYFGALLEGNMHLTYTPND